MKRTESGELGGLGGESTCSRLLSCGVRRYLSARLSHAALYCALGLAGRSAAAADAASGIEMLRVCPMPRRELERAVGCGCSA